MKRSKRIGNFGFFNEPKIFGRPLRTIGIGALAIAGSAVIFALVGLGVRRLIGYREKVSMEGMPSILYGPQPYNRC